MTSTAGGWSSTCGDSASPRPSPLRGEGSKEVRRGTDALSSPAAAAAVPAPRRGKRLGRLRLDLVGRRGLEVGPQEQGQDPVAMLVLGDPPGDRRELREVVEGQVLSLGGQPG